MTGRKECSGCQRHGIVADSYIDLSLRLLRPGGARQRIFDTSLCTAPNRKEQKLLLPGDTGRHWLPAPKRALIGWHLHWLPAGPQTS